MKKTVSLFILVCLIVAFATPITASTNSDSLNNITIITPDSFEQVFDANCVDDVFYEYQLEVLQENNAKANVVLEIILTINNQTYNISSEGTVSSYQLNNNDVLWEGPLDSSLYINNEKYTAIIGFCQLVSTQQSTISLTIQKDSTIVAISFGDNIISGSVLDFFLEKSNNGSTNINNNISINSQFANLNPEDSYSVNSFPSQFTPVIDPGGGGGTSLNLGANGEWVYQSLVQKQHNNSSYNALKSVVYFDDSRNILMVTFTPFSEETNLYAQTLGYDFAAASLDRFRVELFLEDVPAANYAHIEFVDVPNDISNPDNYFNGNTQYLSPLFEDFISILGVPTSTISTILDGLQGKIESQGQGISAYVDIEKPLTSDYGEFDNLPYGLPFRFQLSKGNEQNYIGNTPYTVNVHAKYFVLAQNDVFMSDPVYYRFYIETSTTHQGEITLS